MYGDEDDMGESEESEEDNMGKGKVSSAEKKQD